MAHLVSADYSHPIAQLTYRPGRGPTDYPDIYRIHVECREADQTDLLSTFEFYHGRVASVGDIAHYFAYCDHAEDVLIAETGTKMIGYARAGQARDWGAGVNSYWVDVLVTPYWRGKGIEDRLLTWLETRSHEIQKARPDNHYVLTAAASSLAHCHRLLLERSGYRLFRNHDDLALDTFEGLPKAEVIHGVHLRAAGKEDFRQVWDQCVQSMLEAYPTSGFGSEADYEAWCGSSSLSHRLSWAAWSGDQVVGVILSELRDVPVGDDTVCCGTVDQLEVSKEWRRKGIARALLLSSLAAMSGAGATVARIHTPTDNSYGACTLYQSVGFRLVKQQGYYVKECAPPTTP